MGKFLQKFKILHLIRSLISLKEACDACRELLPVGSDIKKRKKEEIPLCLCEIQNDLANYFLALFSAC